MYVIFVQLNNWWDTISTDEGSFICQYPVGICQNYFMRCKCANLIHCVSFDSRFHNHKEPTLSPHPPRISVIIQEKNYCHSACVTILGMWFSKVWEFPFGQSRNAKIPSKTDVGLRNKSYERISFQAHKLQKGIHEKKFVSLQWM